MACGLRCPISRASCRMGHQEREKHAQDLAEMTWQPEEQGRWCKGLLSVDAGTGALPVGDAALGDASMEERRQTEHRLTEICVKA
jgi:hypothetical protein